MDPLNDMVWTDESEDDIMPTGIGDGNTMAQICTVNASPCSNSGGSGNGNGNGGDISLYTASASATGANECGC